jgi:hypothetical protein
MGCSAASARKKPRRRAPETTLPQIGHGRRVALIFALFAFGTDQMTSLVSSGLIRRTAFWLITIAAILFMARVFLAVDARSHSASDTLDGVFPYWGVTFLLWDWIARRLRRT